MMESSAKPELPTDGRCVSVDEFAQLSGLSLKTVWRRLGDGTLPKFQPGGPGTRVTIPLEAAFGLIASNPSSATQSDIPQCDHPPESRTKIPGPKPHWLR